MCQEYITTRETVDGVCPFGHLVPGWPIGRLVGGNDSSPICYTSKTEWSDEVLGSVKRSPRGRS
jgi:hypothetical protein